MSENKNFAEDVIKNINQNIFLKEFSFSENKIRDNKVEVELADNVVWLDDILFIIQIKSRDKNHEVDLTTETKWFTNKILKKAKSQIKNTIEYFKNHPNLFIENGRNYLTNLKDAPIDLAKKLIIYYPGDKLPQEKRFEKFIDSREVGLINLFHIEDYLNICKLLITPIEINEYLTSRESLYNFHKYKLAIFPEQLILGHFLSGDPPEFLEPEHIKYLTNFISTSGDFNISSFLNKFYENQINDFKDSNQYHLIIKEIAKLNRLELREFKIRFKLAFEKSKLDSYTTPYRMATLETKCGFVFIPLIESDSVYWNNILQNLTLAHKYDQKLDKCIGVIIFRDPKYKEWFEIYWCFVEFPWEHDDEWEEILKNSSPFRDAKLKELGNRYNFDTDNNE